MHLRLVVTAPNKIFPDAMIPSSLNVGDRAGAVELVADAHAIHVMVAVIMITPGWISGSRTTLSL